MNIDTELIFKGGSLKKVNSFVMSVISNKGGVGKTSIAICCGLYFANKQNKKTIIIELDSSPGDFGSLFDISNDNSLDIAIKFPDRFKNYVKNIQKTKEGIYTYLVLVLAALVQSKYDFLRCLPKFPIEYQSLYWTYLRDNLTKKPLCIWEEEHLSLSEFLRANL